MNETVVTILTICLVILVVLALVLIAFGILLLVIWVKARKSVRTFFKTFTTSPDLAYLDTLKLRDNQLSHTEVRDVRDLLRRRKETEARDQDTIDKATEFHSDF